MNAEPAILERVDSNIGAVVLASSCEGQLLSLEFESKEEQLRRYVEAIGYCTPDAILERPTSGNARLVAAYFDGDVQALDRIDVFLTGSPFRKRAALAMREIPAGSTQSYGTIAALLGNPGGARAVARVAATNPLTLVIPCHRVVGSGGQLTGYGAGVDRKRWLLHHEAHFARK